MLIAFGEVSGLRTNVGPAASLWALDGFGSFGRAEIAAAGALVDYVALTQQGGAPHLAPPIRVAPDTVMQIDAATRRNLELATTLATLGCASGQGYYFAKPLEAETALEYWNSRQH